MLLIAICGKAYAHESSKALKVLPLLKTQTSWDGKAISYPKGRAEISAIHIEVAPGAKTDWHWHNVPSFAYMLEGELQVTQKNGKQKMLTAGEALAEDVGTLHYGHNTGKVPAKLVVFYAGAVDVANTVRDSKVPASRMKSQ